MYTFEYWACISYHICFTVVYKNIQYLQTLNMLKVRVA